MSHFSDPPKHRAERIIEAVAEAIRSWSPSTLKVYEHRRLSLSEEQDELPAISVDYGEDTPVEEGSYLLDEEGGIQSLLTVNVTLLAAGEDEPSVRRLLLQMRSYVHIAVKKSQTVGLPFVLGIHYGGANPPEFDESGDALMGELTTPWGVLYEMNLNDPQ